MCRCRDRSRALLFWLRKWLDFHNALFPPLLLEDVATVEPKEELDLLEELFHLDLLLRSKTWLRRNLEVLVQAICADLKGLLDAEILQVLHLTGVDFVSFGDEDDGPFPEVLVCKMVSYTLLEVLGLTDIRFRCAGKKGCLPPGSD